MTGNLCAWETPPENVYLTLEEVHIWGVSLEQPDEYLTTFRATLSEDEHARAERFKFERHQRRFIASQGYLRYILGQYLQQSPNSLEFGRTERGKPFLNALNAKNLKFNVSHSHELAVYAIMQKQEIGIDVEYLRPIPDAEQIATRFFSPHEQNALLALPPEQRIRAFFACWTRKEAFIKAIGEGLYHPLDQFSVSIAPDNPARLIQIATNPQETRSWTLHAFTPAPDYVAALAVRNPVTCIKYWWLGNQQKEQGASNR